MSSPRRFGSIVGWVGAACLVAGLGLYVVQWTRPADGTPPVGDGPPVSLDEPLPFDASISSGALANGLKYFVRANNQPPGRAEIRLVVNAGSILEDDDQRGLAHVVEHLAFGGTRRFPGQSIGAFLESIGMRFGPSINATTGFDETTYSLQIPTADVRVIDTAVLILAEWAHNVTFEPASVERERKVITEEWRLRRGAGARLQDQQWPVMLAGTKYADRLPIGTPESIQSFTVDQLKRFYTDWYRPDLMAAIAVGDFDPAGMVQRIHDRFSELSQVAAPRPRPSHELPSRSGTDYLVATDQEATATTVTLATLRPPRESIVVSDYRRDAIERLATSMLATRLTDISQLPNGPFVAASASRSLVVRSAELISMTAQAGTGGVLPALSALAVERERLARFGFTESELELQKRNLLRGFERAIAEKDRQVSATLAAEYVRHFTLNEPVPGLAWEYDVTKRLLPGIRLEEANAAGQALIDHASRLVLVVAPKKTNVYIPADEELRAVVAAAATATLQPWIAREATAALMDAAPAPGRILGATEHPSIGVTEWKLSNGVRVLLKPTDFREDQIVVAAVSPGGLSLSSDADLIPAQTATQVVGSMGFGRFGSGDLRRALMGRSVSLQPVIGAYEEGLTGVASRDDLETLFQLIHLTMTAPRRDPAIFSALQTQMRAAVANQSATPEFAFGEAMALAVSQDHPRARPLGPDAIGRMDMDRSLAFFKQRFGDAGDFLFVWTGAFTLAGIRPLVERYLASLPATGRSESWRDVGIRPPQGVVRRTVVRGVEPKGRVGLVFTGPMQPDATTALGALADVLQTRLRIALREDLGGTYGVAVGATASRVPIGQSTVSVDFTADPSRLGPLTDRVFAEVAALREAGPTPGDLRDVQAARLRDFENSSRQNVFLANQLAQRSLAGEPLGQLWQTPDLIRNLTVEMLRDAAQRFLDPSNVVQVTLTPAGGQTR